MATTSRQALGCVLSRLRDCTLHTSVYARSPRFFARGTSQFRAAITQ